MTRTETVMEMMHAVKQINKNKGNTTQHKILTPFTDTRVHRRLSVHLGMRVIIEH